MAHISIKNIYGKTPLHIATDKNFKEIAELLVLHGSKNNVHT
ncbi:hypothetical protein TVAG_238330 [Trichomonas vaginalis G3]|uniref:Uncharacterized protein n=1 Tax=Trichomonas vaginalis (strain ATCC PRA-98 / G3) TaxID=412133 RepID=A2DD33_TRIV3|nr:Ankyrin repeat family [Trichomonas vaginalis G3]EAY21807.1 hypothetical protein TVAG_238330 [Trichomonas vaginalis G3]KAI5524237.1 Ankyrin repeat family [Trichomonas vaginalis G3]|eukprot:XP_001582793.1 hypothetical protein [Trichomonas vaginalis G3]